MDFNRSLLIISKIITKIFLYSRKDLSFSTLISIILILSPNNAYAQWNNPYDEALNHNIYFSAYVASPKTFDPAKTYDASDIMFIAQIYEPPLQYDYLKRPYQIIPLTATSMPEVRYYDKENHEIKSDQNNTNKINYTTYDIQIHPGIYYQPHPALARNSEAQYRYLHLTKEQIKHHHHLNDFFFYGTRELVANDYVYQIKRIADPKISSPIFGLMSRYIIDLSELRNRLNAQYQKLHDTGHNPSYLVLKAQSLLGAKVISRYHYQIKIKGFYPQFQYWLTMLFFAPMPWEADAFYSQPGMNENNLSLDQFPVGTGPYLIQKNDPNSEIVMKKNPNFHSEIFPTGDAISQNNIFSTMSGKTLPLINQFVFSLEKESIPRWQKFLQGYYDRSSITPEGFDQAIQLDNAGKPVLTQAMQQQGIYLNTAINTTDFYIGFNMLDPIVGGYSEAACKLRQAISIAIDYEEYIAIFLNGRGAIAQGPIPPGIFGYQEGKKGINSFIYNWNQNLKERKSIATAKSLLAESGYPDGRDPKTGQSLILNYDTATTSGPDEYSELNWIRKQLQKIGIELNIRATLPSRFQTKLRSGEVQLFSSGWSADYPDPENFLFLFYGPNSMVKQNGENTSNYDNPIYDALFEQMAALPNNALRQEKINQMLHILQHDSPWVWGYHPITFILSQPWVNPVKPSDMANNLLKYYSLEPEKRARLLKQWNKPILWPLWIVMAIILISFIPLLLSYYQKQHRPNIKRYHE